MTLRWAALALSAASMRTCPFADCSQLVAALPLPIIHIKGFASRILLPGSSTPPFRLRMRDEPKLNKEKAEATRLADLLVEAICATNPKTLVWDGDDFSPGSFTALIPRIVERLPGLQLCAFAYEDRESGFCSSWSPVLDGLATPSPLLLVVVPAAEAQKAMEVPPVSDSVAVHDHKYIRLGRLALETTGSKRIFSLGGGGVAAEELALALNDEPPCSITLAPVRRWLDAPAEQGPPPAEQAPRALEMEDSAERLAPLRCEWLGTGGSKAQAQTQSERCCSVV